MSTETLPRDDTGLSTIEGIDLDLEVKCDDPGRQCQHDHPADVITLFRCVACGLRLRRPRCWDAVRRHRSGGTYCIRCGHDHDDAIKVVEVLRP